jgi:hypothetical protein
MGHSVLVVPVPSLEPYVRDRTAFYDASFLSTDAAFVHAHITVLGPWLADPDAAQLDTVADIVAARGAFDYALEAVVEFPDGVIHLRPEPEEPFAELTAALVEAFPQCPPYGGQYGDVRPHLTLDRRSTTVTPATVRAELAGVLPVQERADRVDLQWWDNVDCHVRRTWELA